MYFCLKHLNCAFTGTKLFGDGYSGLEYDYRGLLRLYRTTDQRNMADLYSSILQNWNTIRDTNENKEIKPLDFDIDQSLQNLIWEYSKAEH